MNDVKSSGPAFCYVPLSFSPEPCNSFLSAYFKFNGDPNCSLDEDVRTYVSRRYKGEAMKVLRSIDVEKIRHERVMKSFTIGRQIRSDENTDRRI